MRTTRAKSDNLSCLPSSRALIIAYVCSASAALLVQEHGLYTLDAASHTSVYCLLQCLANNCGADTLDATAGRNQPLSDPVGDKPLVDWANVCFRSGLPRLFHPEASQTALASGRGHP